MTVRGIIFILGAYLAIGPTLGRAQYADVGLWFGAGLKQDLNKAWNWTLEWENRWDMGITHHDRMLVDIGLERRLNKHWDLNGQWRWSEDEVGLGYLPSNRIALRLNGGWKSGPGQFRTRIMATQDWTSRRAFEGSGDANFEPTLRLRWGYDVRINNDWEAGTSVEILKTAPLIAADDLRSRWQLGASRKMSESWSLQVIYLLGNEWLEDDPWTDHIFRVQSNWNLVDWKDLGKRQRIPKSKTYPPPHLNRNAPSPPTKVACSIEQILWSEVDAKGQPADFIELKNAGAEGCSMEGWRLTDSLEQLGLIFGDVFIPSEGYWVGYEGGQNSFDFGISAEGESLFLISPNGEALTLTTLNQPDERSQNLDFSGVLKLLPRSPGAPPPAD